METPADIRTKFSSAGDNLIIVSKNMIKPPFNQYKSTNTKK